jgi:hypothetical protein
VSLDNPVWLKHYFAEEERKDEASRTKTIERLIAELEILDDEYIEPEPFIDIIENIKVLKISTANIQTEKAVIIADRKKKLEEPIEEIMP